MSRTQRLGLHPRLGWVFLCYAFLGIVGAARMLRTNVRAADVAALVCLLVAFGVWHRRAWARWLGVAVSGWVAFNTVAVLAAGGRISGAALGALIVHAWLACMLTWRWPKR